MNSRRGGRLSPLLGHARGDGDGSRRSPPWTTFPRSIVRDHLLALGRAHGQPRGSRARQQEYAFRSREGDGPRAHHCRGGRVQERRGAAPPEGCQDGFTNPKKKMLITPFDEGATNHCVMENRSIVGQVLFDWLDDVFK